MSGSGGDCRACSRMSDRVAQLEDVLSLPENELRKRIDDMMRNETKRARELAKLRNELMRIRPLVTATATDPK